MAVIVGVKAEKALASGNTPTVAVTLTTDTGESATATGPVATSAGSNELFVIPVDDAVRNINTEIGPRMVELQLEPRDPHAVDGFLINLKNGEGASSTEITPISMAASRLGAQVLYIPLHQHINVTANDIATGILQTRPSLTRPELIQSVERICPVICCNELNGGLHVPGSTMGNFKGLSIQEFMVLITGADNYPQAYGLNQKVHETFAEVLEARLGKGNLTFGHERGYTPTLPDAGAALDLIREVVEAAGAKGMASVALDAAASSFYDLSTGLYHVDGQDLTESQLSDYYVNLCKKYPEIVSIEDPFFENHFKAHALLTARLAKLFGGRVQTVGDDLYTTNPVRLEKGIGMKATNAVLVKINQIGTLWEAIEFTLMARAAGMGAMVSHRSKEPAKEPFIVHFAVGTGCGLLKSGAPEEERKDKYEELKRIVTASPLIGYANEDFRSPRPMDPRMPVVDKSFARGAGGNPCIPSTMGMPNGRRAAK
ncbi:Enolase [Candidatus Burarchaeum australiense]|nr:Enolase [Candidatus Burarchaeum australiense]